MNQSNKALRDDVADILDDLKFQAASAAMMNLELAERHITDRTDQIIALVTNHIKERLPERQPLQDPEPSKMVGVKTWPNGDTRLMTEKEMRSITATSPSVFKQMGFNMALDKFETILEEVSNEK